MKTIFFVALLCFSCSQKIQSASPEDLANRMTKRAQHKETRHLLRNYTIIGISMALGIHYMGWDKPGR